MLSINDAAPDFEAITCDGARIKLSEFRNKKNIVLFFYLKNFSPSCTTQVRQFRDEYSQLQNLDCEIIGISYDDSGSQSKFKSLNKLPYHLISDRNKTLAHKYDVTRFGGFLPFVKRVTYVIDKSGAIRNVIHREFNVSNHLVEVRKTLHTIYNPSP
jgi:thioredoxin-dependent peroxiredoxin